MRISIEASFILRCDVSRLVHESNIPCRGRGYYRRLLTLRIDEVESDTSLAYACRFAAIHAIWQCLVAFEMTLSAGKTSRAHTSRLVGSAFCDRLSVTIGDRHGVDTAGAKPVRIMLLDTQVFSWIYERTPLPSGRRLLSIARSQGFRCGPS